MARAERRLAHHFGLDAEFWAETLLRFKGYRICARRFRAAGGEIDLIVRRGNTLVFVEVKARASEEAALLAITPHKYARIAQAARFYLGGLAAMPATIRLDAVLVTPWRLPRHLAAIGELPLDAPHSAATRRRRRA